MLYYRAPWKHIHIDNHLYLRRVYVAWFFSFCERRRDRFIQIASRVVGKKHFARFCDCKQTEKWQNGKTQIQRAMRRHSCDWTEEKSGTQTQTEKKNQDRMLK